MTYTREFSLLTGSIQAFLDDKHPEWRAIDYDLAIRIGSPEYNHYLYIVKKDSNIVVFKHGQVGSGHTQIVSFTHDTLLFQLEAILDSIKKAER